MAECVHRSGSYINDDISINSVFGDFRAEQLHTQIVEKAFHFELRQVSDLDAHGISIRSLLTSYHVTMALQVITPARHVNKLDKV